MESKDMFHQSGEYAFQFLFGEKFQSFKEIFDNNIDQLKKQLDKEELYECDSKTCLVVLKKQFETFFDPKSSLSYSYQYQSNLALQKKKFQEYAHYTSESLKETILSYLNSIEKRIDERACHEEELRITEKGVKDKQARLEMKKQETVVQKSECSSRGDNSNAKREKQKIKENCNKTFQELKKVVFVLNPRVLFANENELAFEVLFGEDYDSFVYKFYHNLARLENQMSCVEFHECDSKTYLIELRKQLFQKYTHHDIKSMKNMLVRYLNVIEKEIDARAHHEEELARAYVSRAGRWTESEMMDECSKSVNDTRAEGADIRLSNDTKSLHEVQSTAAYNVITNDRQQAEQPKFINEGKVDQDAEQCLDTRPLLAFIIGNKTTESLNQTLESENDCLKKTIAKLQKDFSKLEAQSIAFEIALQHKSQENNSLKTLQKENENFLASLQIENAHLKQTYKDLFESVQRSKVETNQCDEVKVNVNFDEIETKNIELEHQVASLLKENEHLKLVYKNLFDSIKKPRVQKENLRATLSEFSVNHIFGKEDSSPSLINELEKESGENICENAKCEFQTNIVELEKVLTQKTKDFDDAKLELSNRTAKFEAYFEKLEKTKVVLKRQLARKVDDSKAEKDQFLKEMNHLRTQLENLKGKSVETKFDKSSILGKPSADKLLINS
ncbi:hypothetical protein Tco_1175487 [Tanacetum coccineum]